MRHIEFDVAGTLLEGRFLPGQSIGVLAPGHDAEGRTLQCALYSVASPTGGEDGGEDHLDDGEAFDRRALGDEQAVPGRVLELSVRPARGRGPPLGPNGKKFLLPADPAAHDYVFFATGTGIALPRHGAGPSPPAPRSRVTLVMGSPFATDLLYDEQFRAWSKQHANFQYITAISRESRRTDRSTAPGDRADYYGPMYVQDRIRSHGTRSALLCSARTLVYVCGIAGMELGSSRNWPDAAAYGVEQYLAADDEAAEEHRTRGTARCCTVRSR